MEDALKAKSANEWEWLFNDAGVPAGPILNVPDIEPHHSSLEQFASLIRELAKWSKVIRSSGVKAD